MQSHYRSRVSYGSVEIRGMGLAHPRFVLGFSPALQSLPILYQPYVFALSTGFYQDIDVVLFVWFLQCAHTLVNLCVQSNDKYWQKKSPKCKNMIFSKTKQLRAMVSIDDLV